MSAIAAEVCSFDETLTVLFVDDEPGILEIAEEVFSEEFNVQTAESAEEALSMFNAEVDAVVSDRKMPDMDGKELIDELQSRQPNLPTIIISGVPCEEWKNDYKCNKYLRKPVDFERLCAILSEEYRSGKKRR